MRATERTILAAALVVASAAHSRALADCTCRAFGRDFDLGRSACLATPQGLRLATCGMVLNNTAWRFSETPCLATSDRPSVTVIANHAPAGFARVAAGSQREAKPADRGSSP
jgi:hypothetical protein